ncbi:MAG: NUDIX hydrolase [candidate division WOR-3 bacterium]|jgi:ADP-ribose pyrophosphatase YjhB (NUDIX family)|nr:NUDIX hydrolase [candidate division WOR-3 bacterium]MCR4423203.1 NUDIX hydrolase [candidate division WOR-3 bacterium]MDH7518542.1 NUDIX hydrolase [bacterium]
MKYRQPKLAVDCIILQGKRIVLIERLNEPKGWALPGGFVNYGETVEEAVRREIKEETGLSLSGLRQFRVYSAPNRDPRGHCVSVVFVARGHGQLKAGDDARAFKLVELSKATREKLVFDHRKIIADYLKTVRSKTVKRDKR